MKDKPYLPPNAAEIAQAAPLAVSGAVGAPFWEEVNARLNDTPEPTIAPRATVEPSNGWSRIPPAE